jgi:P27 family predicted phage terminase small subunit
MPATPGGRLEKGALQTADRFVLLIESMAQRGRKSRAALAVIGIGSAVVRPHPARTEFDPPQPPSHLGELERAIWAGVFRDYNLSADVASAVLTTALEAHQRARECREAVFRDGMTVVGRDGQTKVHPLLAVERDARAQWLAGVKALGLEL